MQIIDQFASAGLEPPSIEQLQKNASKGKDSVPQLVKLAIDQGQLVKLDEKIILHARTVERIKSSLREVLADGAGITMSDIRQHLNTSHKYAVPICEHLDAVGFTRRDGDLRFLASGGESGKPGK